ncbi:molybdate ABC transporter substrate-binding protein [Ruminococcaceae bacterium OttesenSCG-928-A16]|nr:molybdate ABC transporter substrate-binding protein [Ruminococcaceae bacterium OttesenSCG-928-A16]
MAKGALKIKKDVLCIAFTMVLSLLLASCSGAVGPQASSVAIPPAFGVAQSAEEKHEPVTILVAAAASVEYCYKNELIPMFEKKYPWVTVEGSYDSSGKLQTQIEQGLEADVFMPAAQKQMGALEEQGLIEAGSIVKLLKNEIVLIVPAGGESIVKSFEDVVNSSSLAVGDPETVPAGQYAKEALTSLGLWEAVKASASYGTNVTEVLHWVAEGSADAGIVYATDAATNPKVKVVATAPPNSLASAIIYPVGILANSAHKTEAELFVEFLQSPAALEVFKKYGFTPNIKATASTP